MTGHKKAAFIVLKRILGSGTLERTAQCICRLSLPIFDKTAPPFLVNVYRIFKRILAVLEIFKYFCQNSFQFPETVLTYC